MAFKIFKTLVSIEGGGGSVFQMDTIEYEGKKWLVPKWLEARPKDGKGQSE